MSFQDDIPVLIAQSGTLRGQRWNLLGPELRIGRDGQCDIIVSDKTVSRRHARLFREGEHWFLENSSKNGTHVNDILIQDVTMLQDSDVITIATAIKLVFVGSDATVPLSMTTSHGKLRINAEARQVWIGNTEIEPPLSLPQYRLVSLLHEKSGHVCTREEVVNAVWPDAMGVGVSEQSIDALVRRVRDRLSEYDDDHQYIVTVRGHGFRLDNPLMRG